jgi:proteasome activator subunit 4
MVPVLTSFLPPTNIRAYVPALFALWRAFNSSVIDDRLLEFFADIAEEQAESADEWREIGLWTEAEWTFLSSKMLNSMSTCGCLFVWAGD